MTRHGYFTQEDGLSQFVLTDPCTPRTWQLYLVNDFILTQLDQGANGVCRYWDEQGMDVFVTSQGRSLHVREADGTVWSPVAAPGAPPPADYQCRYAPEAWRLQARRDACRVSWQIAVPLHDPVEMWTVALRNTSAQPWSGGLFLHVPADTMGFSYRTLYRFYSESNRCFLQGRHEPELNALWIHNQTPYLPHARYSVFFASDVPCTSFDTTPEAYQGTNGTVPALQRGCCSNSLAYTGAMCLALHFEVTVPAGGRTALHFLLGATTGKADIAALCGRLLSGPAIAAATAEVAAARRREAAQSRLTTALPALDSLGNVWAKCQNRLGVLHRKGFRDVLQDAAGMSTYDAERARAGLEEVIAVQKHDGRGIRAWKPYLDAEHYSDGQYWLPLAVAAWLRETGDFGFLERPLPYLDGPAEPVWTHLLKGVQHLYHDRNERGLCRIRFADWNDALDAVGREGRGDSTMVTMSLICALREMRGLANRTGRALPYDTDEWIAALTDALERHAWTGEYYIRGYRDDGQPYGHPDCQEGRIYLNPQAWAILSGCAPRARWAALMDVAERDLETPHGLKLVWPSYTKFDPHMGRISATLPGVYENGGTYNHAAVFYISAALHAGDVSRAWRHLQVILPDSAANPSDRTGAEPFVLTNCIFGDEAGERAGTSFFGWYTGTAAWALRLIHNGFSGLAPDYDGLYVHPARIPPAIGLKQVERLFRGTRYRMTVSTGPALGLFVDGQPADPGQPLPLRPDGLVAVGLRLPR